MVAPRSFPTLLVQSNATLVQSNATLVQSNSHSGALCNAHQSTRVAVHQRLPLQGAHNRKKPDQLCQSLKPAFPLKGFDQQEPYNGTCTLEKIEIISPKSLTLLDALLHEHYLMIDCILLSLNKAHIGEKHEFVGV